jgi:hypothetical protein
MKHIKTFEDFVNESVNEGRGPETVKEPKAKDIEVKDKYKKGEGIFYRVTFPASTMVANSKSETSKSVYYARIDKVTKDGRGEPVYIVGWEKVPHNMVIGAKVNESLNEAQHIDINWCLKTIKEWNKESDTNSYEDLAKDIIKHLGFKVKDKNIEIASDHLASCEQDNGDLPVDADIIKELIPMLESTNEGKVESWYIKHDDIADEIQELVGKAMDLEKELKGKVPDNALKQYSKNVDELHKAFYKYKDTFMKLGM